ncbi:MAG: peroxiredoxin family protein [Marinifilaceae bacterium]
MRILKLSFLTCGLLIMFSSFGQNSFRIKGNVLEWSGSRVSIHWFDEADLFALDSTMVDAEGNFQFDFNGEKGIYRLSQGNDIVDIMVDQPLLDFRVEGLVENGEISFRRSGENNLFHYYRSELNHIAHRLQEGERLIDSLHSTNVDYRKPKNELSALRKEWKQLVHNLWIDHKQSWPARMAIGEIDVAIGRGVKEITKDLYRQKHFFDYLDFTDTVLLKSPLFYHKLDEFIQISKMDEKINSQNWKGVQKVIDQLFYEAEVNLYSQERLTNFLFKRFPDEKYPEVYRRITEAYCYQNTCEYIMSNRLIRNRVHDSQEMVLEEQIADFVLPNVQEGRTQTFSEVNGKAILLVFWSASCPHSNFLLDRMRNLYEQYHENGFEIVAVSLDSSKDFWEQVTEDRNYHWINSWDPEGLRSELVSLFNVYRTPMMFLFDEDLTITGFPLTYFQLEGSVKKMFPVEL